MSEKNKKEEDSEDYSSKLDGILKTIGGAELNEATSEDKQDEQKPSGIEKVDLGEDKVLDAMDINFDEEELETQNFASKILDMVDLKQKLMNKKDDEEIKDTQRPIIHETPVKRSKTDYVVSPVHVPTVVTWKAYKRMVGYAIRYANETLDTKKWREVYGILIGAVEDDSKVIVKDAIPMVVGDRAGVQYENKQYVDMAQIDQSVYERSIQNKKEDFIVGWWHTHPGFGYFFSEVDCYTQLGYQIPNPFAVGLIFDHCEKKLGFLGIAGLRLLEPDEGILSDYDTIELNYEEDKDEIEKKIQRIVNKINKEMPKVLKEITYIDEVLRKKALAQLQRNYGLILVPKREIKVVEDEDMAEEDERFLYVWDPEFFKKSYRIPKFRERVEEQIVKFNQTLAELKEKGQTKKLKDRKKKFTEKIEAMLVKPNEWYNRLIEDFSSRLETIFPLYDYLDTDERKIIEHFEERTTQYRTVLDSLMEKAKFN